MSAERHSDAPAIWLLELAEDGAPLTATYALGRPIVREAVQRWPRWWSDALGPPTREAEVYPLDCLHDGLKRLGLVRRRGRTLLTTKRGRELAEDPPELMAWLAADLGGQDEFTDSIAATVMSTLEATEAATFHDLSDLAHAGVLREGWHDPAGHVPSVEEVMGLVGLVLARGQGYGVLSDVEEGLGSPVALTPEGRAALERVCTADRDAGWS